MNQQSEFERREQAANIADTSYMMNNDPREQRQAQEREPLQDTEAYQAGYAAAMRQRMEGYEGQKIYPQSQRRRRPRRLWIAASIILLLLVLGGAFNFATNVTGNHATLYPTRTFTVGAMPKIIVNAQVGSIRFHTGASDTVTVTATEKDSGLFNQSHAVNVESTQDSNSNTITVNEQKTSGSDFMHNKNVDIDVTLPANSNIQSSLNLGNITINGVSGTMDVKDNTGKVEIEDSTLTGTSSIRENIGDITFQGSITNDGDYTFEDNTGAINLTFPADQIFALDSKTNIGKVSNEFNSNDNPANTESHIHLHLKNNIGAININKQ
ncbi:DUF4097 domain-containing protein [Dictyobacter arantiisoli]|uniref:Adhesin domain-containing protein n=1 Tax=Dictyobacter arantiisoli TaxID=2014874 RepID=A0A5A5TGK5_9CHLR|nr:DUF4097 domain-containing protein [Dictyobacter arantiisoli]GCF10159.1 hypothetical protein KDI_37230 [Dictyobacter arantiisoli]